MTEHIFLPPTTKRRPSNWAIALSLLLNLLFAALLIYVNYVWKKEAEKLAAEQQQVQVDIVPAPPPPQPQAQQQPPPPPPQQQQQQEKKEENSPEKKEEEKKEDEKKKPPEKPPEKQPEKEPEKQKQEKLAKPAPPQLLQGKLSEKSSTDRHDDHNGANGENVAITMGPGPLMSIHMDQDGTKGPEGSRGPIGEELSQTEQDYVLSQILPYWKVDTHRPEGRGMVLEAIIEINSDGTLMHPLGRDDPWNPGGIIAGYAEMTRLGYSYKREALEGFLLALRLSQPIKVPPGGKWPKWMKLRFAFDDL